MSNKEKKQLSKGQKAALAVGIAVAGIATAGAIVDIATQDADVTKSDIQHIISEFKPEQEEAYLDYGVVEVRPWR